MAFTARPNAIFCCDSSNGMPIQRLFWHDKLSSNLAIATDNIKYTCIMIMQTSKHKFKQFLLLSFLINWQRYVKNIRYCAIG